jgi:ABC-2 type transport system permease protein
MMLGRLLAIEWIKAVGRQAFWAVLLFFASLVALFAGSSLYNHLWRQGPPFRLPDQWAAVVNVGSLFGLFSLLAIVVLLTADERGWRTDRQNVIDGLTRDQYFAGKTLLLLVLALAFWAVAVTVGGGMAMVGTVAAPPAEAPLRPADAAHLGGFLLFLLLVGAIALFFGTVVPGSGGALAVATLFLLVLLILGQVLRMAGPPAAGIADYLPTAVLWDLTEAAAYDPRLLAEQRQRLQTGERVLEIAPPGRTVPLAALYVALFVGAAWRAFRARDL